MRKSNLELAHVSTTTTHDSKKEQKVEIKENQNKNAITVTAEVHIVMFELCRVFIELFAAVGTGSCVGQRQIYMRMVLLRVRWTNVAVSKSWFCGLGRLLLPITVAHYTKDRITVEKWNCTGYLGIRVCKRVLTHLKSNEI